MRTDQAGGLGRSRCRELVPGLRGPLRWPLGRVRRSGDEGFGDGRRADDEEDTPHAREGDGAQKTSVGWGKERNAVVAKADGLFDRAVRGHKPKSKSFLELSTNALFLLRENQRHTHTVTTLLIAT